MHLLFASSKFMALDYGTRVDAAVPNKKGFCQRKLGNFSAFENVIFTISGQAKLSLAPVKTLKRAHKILLHLSSGKFAICQR